MSTELTLGSSDVPAILCGRLWDVWMRLFYPKDVDRGELPEFERGKRLEPALAAWYSEEYGSPLRKCETIYHPHYPYLRATPDYESLDPDLAYVEMKTKHWISQPASCEIEHEFQVRYQMAVGGRKMGYVWAWYMKDLKPVRWPFPRDPGLEKRMLEIVTDFYERFVREKKEPPADVSKAYSTYLNHLPAKDEGLVVEGDHPVALLAEACRKWQRLAKVADAKYDTLMVELKDQMRDLGWIKGPFGSATFREVKGATHKDWEQIARWLGVALMSYLPKAEAERIFQEVVAKFTVTGQNYRRLNPRWSKGPILVEHADVVQAFPPPADHVQGRGDPEPASESAGRSLEDSASRG